MKKVLTYDYIIVGAGAAGLLLANAMAIDPFFSNKKILLLDPDPKETNDRTWCFWEKSEGPLEALISQKWPNIGVSHKTKITTVSIAPYQYKMLEGDRFYKAMKTQIANAKNIVFKQEAVLEFKAVKPKNTNGIGGSFTKVRTAKNYYRARVVCSSIFSYKPLLNQKKYPVLQQHFMGWFVKTKKEVFQPNRATFMDFSIPQKGNTRFMYVLPTSSTTALVEYTLFSKDRLAKETYEAAIAAHLKTLGVQAYEITATEAGSIPMTCYPFEQHHTPSLLHIGTAGGWSKPSTGFTFANTQKKIPALIQHLKSGKPLVKFYAKNRFWLYDLILLEVLATDNSQGKHIFEGLFNKRPAPLILKFLSEETNFWEELYIMSAANTWQFTKAFFRVLVRGL